MSGSPVRDALRSRRTVFRFKKEQVPKEDLLKILEAGTWAPNHHLTQPWRFIVVGPETDEILAERYRDIQMAKVKGKVPADILELAGQKGVDKWKSKPTVVFVSCRQEGDEQERREDYAAACCAMLGIQLAAAEVGVGLQWSTGPITMEDATYKLLNVNPENEYIIGLLYMGYPEEFKEPSPRLGVEEVTRWTD